MSVYRRRMSRLPVVSITAAVEVEFWRREAVKRAKESGS